MNILKKLAVLAFAAFSFLPALAQETDPNINIAEQTRDFPLYNIPVTDTTFNSFLTRIGGDAGVPFGSISGSWGGYARHHYSIDQPWNADGSYFVIVSGPAGGNGGDRILLNGSSYLPAKNLETECGWTPSDDRWHPNILHKFIRIGVDDTTMEWLNVATCQIERTFTLPFDIDGVGIAGYAGNPDNSGRYIAVMSQDGTQASIIDMDPQPPYAPWPNYRVGPIISTTGCGLASCNVSHLTISASGNYLMVKYLGDHVRVLTVAADLSATPLNSLPNTGCTGVPNGMGYATGLGHPDIGLDGSGVEYIVGQQRSWCPETVPAGGSIVKVRLPDGQYSRVSPSPEKQAHHVSMRAYLAPGVVTASYHMDGTHSVRADEVVTMNLDGSNMKRWIQTHTNTAEDYTSEAHAVPSPNASSIAYSSTFTQFCSPTCGVAGSPKAFVVKAIPSGGGGGGGPREDQ